MINMTILWMAAMILAVSTSGCILKNKQFTITDKQTGIEIIVSEDDLNVVAGDEIDAGAFTIKAEEKP